MFSLATNGAPGRPNEDFVIATTDIAIVIDGAGVPMGGCSHGVAWFARQLGALTMASLVGQPERCLSDGLSEGIRRVAGLHAHTCDLTDRGTPCAAVGILRVRDEHVDTLALSDVTVVVEAVDGPVVTCDLGIEELCGTEPDALAGKTFGSPEHVSALAGLVECQTKSRNKPDGWWVAAADPEAAQHAHTMTFPRRPGQRMAVMSDGATRPVDQMGLYDWTTYLAMLDKLGPIGLIEHVREIETDDPAGKRFARTKRHDDASIAMWTGAGLGK